MDQPRIESSALLRYFSGRLEIYPFNSSNNYQHRFDPDCGVLYKYQLNRTDVYARFSTAGSGFLVPEKTKSLIADLNDNLQGETQVLLKR